MVDAGNARSLLLTVLGDLVLPSGGRAWQAALAEAGALVGVEPDATQRALRALVDEGLLEATRHGRLAAYGLTVAGRRRLEEAADRIYLRRDARWDGRWRLLSFGVAGSSEDGAALDRELRWLGYGRLSSGLWVCPWDHGARLDAVLAKHGVTREVEAFTGDLEGDPRSLAAEAYDLDALRDAHGTFLAAYAGANGEPLEDGEALRRRLELVHAWRKLLFVDPVLPRELTPPDSLGAQAAGVFVERYARYEAGGWRAWDALVAAVDPDGVAPPHPWSPFAGPGSGGAGAGTAAGALERRAEDFRERLAAGHKVEAGDWMPDAYRKVALKFIEMHANSEIMGALPEREWIARAPSLKRKRSLAAKVQDEVGHAHLIYRVAQDLGKSREAMFDDLIAGRTKFHNVFHYPADTWGDVAVIGFLVDGAAIVTQKALLDTSYAPYLRCMRRVVAEESLHQRHGEDLALALAAGTQEQFELLQDAVTRWWEPLLHFFGHDTPADKDVALQWGIKTRTNEESRQEFFDTYVPKLWDMGIEVPDEALRYDPQEKRWRYTEPDWSTMDAIIRGEGPRTQVRLWWRHVVRTHHDWIREVVTGDLVPA